MSGAHIIVASEAPMKVRWAEVSGPEFWAMFPSEVLAIPLGKTSAAGFLPYGAMPVGRVLIRAVGNAYGRNSFLSTDAAFARWDGVNGQAWSQDRKAAPTIAPIGSGGPVTGGNGRTPDTRAWEENSNITFMGPIEGKWRNPYGIVVRGAGLGLKAALKDNFFFEGTHWHGSDHRGPNKPLGSTRIYDYRRARTDEDGTPVGLPDETMWAGLDTMTVVVPQANGNAGGSLDQQTLAENFSGDTGPGFGSAAFKISEAKSTSEKLRMIVGYRSYEKYGPFSGGAIAGDKHLEGTNREGNPVQVAHIHIGAKFTDDGTFYDGRRHVDPVIEPNCGASGLPWRVWEQFRPTYPDPYFFDVLRGVWDLHTRLPMGMVTIDPDPRKDDSDPNKDADPNKAPYDDADPNKITDDDDPNKIRKPEPGRPVFPKPDPVDPEDQLPGAATVEDDGEGGAGGGNADGRDGGNGAGVPSFPRDWHGPPKFDRVATAWTPVEIAAPSLEFQPMIGNTAPPAPFVGNADAIDPLTGGPVAIDELGQPTPARAELEQLSQEQRIENVMRNITGASTSDSFKAPFTGHFEAYYRHKFTAPQGRGRSLKNFPPDYAKRPKLTLGSNWAEHRAWERGAANGLLLFCGPENKPERNRHDYAGPVEDFTTVQTLGIYTGHLLGFGKASSNWDEIVDGVRIGLTDPSTLNFAFVTHEGVANPLGAIAINGVPVGGGSTPPAEVDVGTVSETPLDMAGVADRDTIILTFTGADSTVPGFDEPDDDTEVMEVWIYNPENSGYALIINDYSDTVSNVVTGLGAAYTLGPGQSVKARWGVGDQLWYLL